MSDLAVLRCQIQTLYSIRSVAIPVHAEQVDMIDIKREQLLTLAEASRKLPSSRRGKKVHVATIFRWHKHGSRGVKLECVRVGSSLMTTVEALQRFIERLSAVQEAGSTLPPPIPTLDERDVIARLKGKRLLPRGGDTEDGDAED
jgi:hypothetical protein